jgi:hypothetical protein
MWSADSQRVAFQSDREGDSAIFWQPADGTGGAERLTKPDEGTTHAPESWAPDGEHFLFRAQKGSDISLWAFALKEKKAVQFGGVRSSNPTNAVFSPDGRWVAYHARETGKTFDEVFVQPFPATGAKYQLPISRDNHHPIWLSGGKELFYTPGSGLSDAVVSVTTDGNVAFGNPVPATIGVNSAAPFFPRPFDISPDGKRFIGVVSAEQSQSGAPVAPQIQVVLNWFEDLKARVPVR